MERLAGKRILVTGGTGFIGGHLVDQLIKSGSEIIVFDIVLDPHSTFALKNLKDKARLEFVDIRQKKKLLDAIKICNPSYIVHLAAEAIVDRSYKNPCNAFETNIMGTVYVLEAARMLTDLEGIIVASSDKAYGKTEKVYKEDSPLKADHPYDVSKASADLIAQAYHKTYQLPIVITRFGNVYGEGDLHFDRIIPGICEAIIKKEPLIIRSNGKYIRDYVYVEDVANGYTTLLKNIDTIHGEVYNFSSDDNLSVLQLIKKAEDILHEKISYKILNNAVNEIPYQHLDDQKIKSLG